jgi:hypothetical protein
MPQRYTSINELFFVAEKTMNAWLTHTSQGRWCKKHLPDLTFRVNGGQDDLPTVSVVTKLEEEEYVMYVLKFENTNKNNLTNLSK